ncbi:MAG: recombinase family protein [Anaerotignum sp.]|nr:recombinase family protein [Anaerotignum sp.]
MFEAIYARQSVDKKDSISIETQIELCKNETKNPDNVKIYVDKGYSGSNINRPDFQKLLSDIKAGIISKVIIYRLDRMSRSLLDFSKLIELFGKYGVEFQSTQEKFDTSTPIGKAMLSITMVFAQLERETIQVRIKDNYYSRVQKGHNMGGTIPFGFQKAMLTVDQKNVKTLMVDSEKAPIIESVFSKYAEQGYSLGEIARDLNKMGILSPKGSAWDSCKISRLLRNPVYVRADASVFQYYKAKGCKITNDVTDFIGLNSCYIYGKRNRSCQKYTDVTDQTLSLALHNGIIDSKCFLSCQFKLDRNVQIDNSAEGKHSWLTGMIKCANCGRSLVVRTSNYGKYKYWYCSGKAYFDCDAKFNGISIESAESAIKDKLFFYIQQNDEVVSFRNSENEQEINSISLQIESLKQQVERLIDLSLDANTLTSKYLNERLEKIDAEIEKLSNRQNSLFLEQGGIKQPKQIYDSIKDWDALDNAERREIARQFISEIRLSQDNIKVEWKYNFAANKV